MTFQQLLEKYFQFLWDTFQYDVSVYSQAWVWYSMLVPAFVYTMFFMAKWGVLLIPFYAPILIPLKVYIYSLQVKHINTELVEACKEILTEYEDKDVQIKTPIAYMRKFSKLDKIIKKI